MSDKINNNLTNKSATLTKKILAMDKKNKPPPGFEKTLLANMRSLVNIKGVYVPTKRVRTKKSNLVELFVTKQGYDHSVRLCSTFLPGVMKISREN